MPRYKAYDYDQLVMLPISLENQLVPGTLEHTINELVEKHINLSVFEGQYNNDDIGCSKSFYSPTPRAWSVPDKWSGLA